MTADDVGKSGFKINRDVFLTFSLNPVVQAPHALSASDFSQPTHLSRLVMQFSLNMTFIFISLTKKRCIDQLKAEHQRRGMQTTETHAGVGNWKRIFSLVEHNGQYDQLRCEL